MQADYQLAFEMAPVGLVLSRHRAMVDCNQAVCEMFGVTRDQLVGQSFQVLYPSADEYERTGARIAPILNAKGHYADDRVMRRVGGRFQGETFWCHVTGHAMLAAQPLGAGIWTVEDVSEKRPVTAELTPRERETLRHLARGASNKEIARSLDLAESTVKVHVQNILRKLNLSSRVQAAVFAVENELDREC